MIYDALLLHVLVGGYGSARVSLAPSVLEHVTMHCRLYRVTRVQSQAEDVLIKVDSVMTGKRKPIKLPPTVYRIGSTTVSPRTCCLSLSIPFTHYIS